MTDNEINVAIAKACGWTWIERDIVGPGAGTGIAWTGMPPSGGIRKELPNYCTDLNAMHEAEKTLTEYELQGRYPREIASLVVNCGWLPESSTSILRLVHATARQRAEAFLRTIGRWKEGMQQEVLK